MSVDHNRSRPYLGSVSQKRFLHSTNRLHLPDMAKREVQGGVVKSKKKNKNKNTVGLLAHMFNLHAEKESLHI